MCDVCRLENKDSILSNGDKPNHHSKLFRVYMGKVASVNLCHLHGIELFCVGESRFLATHIGLALDLGENRNRYIQNSYF